MARNAVTVEFTGVENIQEIFNKMPAQYGKKPVQTAFIKAAKPFIAALKANMPPKLSSLSKAIAYKRGKGAAISVGIYAKKAQKTLRDKKDYDAFFPLYWNNYGTYGNRDGSHTFKNTRKGKTANRSGGIKPLRFVERSWDATKEQVAKDIQTELVTQTDKFLKKYAI